MSDLISRQAAIDAIEWHLRREDEIYLLTDTEKTMNHAFEIAASCVYNLPSAQHWIPVSERLPDIKEHHVSEPCIVYCENGAYGFTELEENIFGQVGWNCERDDEYHEPLGEVIAWMPLPKPYKGE